MVGFPPANGKHIVTIERDMGNAVPTNDQDSQTFAQIMEQIAVDYTDLDIMLGPIYDSDYMPFEPLGYVTIGAMMEEQQMKIHITIALLKKYLL